MRPQKLYKTQGCEESIRREEALAALAVMRTLEAENKAFMHYACLADGTIIGSTDSERLKEYVKHHKRIISVWR